MPAINFATREIHFRVVYYGPGLCGKTTNLRRLHERTPASARGRLIELMTETDRTLFFDFMPLELGTIRGFNLRSHVYSTPGQFFYQASRALILRAVDVVVFVADSQPGRREANIESLDDLDRNLEALGFDPGEVPRVIQYNKRDVPERMSLEELRGDLNRGGRQEFEAVASAGVGVFSTFRAAARLAIDALRR
ncbi:MAG: gliding-motility protein MglA [Myxococcales bacterium]|nr:gliding-motility protein MglA [Myxococcales bacterium]MCB9566671.1 gliding-motility protein MglA [Myxococcales bacterium]MCB9704402.1 gliding-motility protein MglA [Myxococcales bacterium]